MEREVETVLSQLSNSRMKIEAQLRQNHQVSSVHHLFMRYIYNIVYRSLKITKPIFVIYFCFRFTSILKKGENKIIYSIYCFTFAATIFTPALIIHFFYGCKSVNNLQARTSYLYSYDITSVSL